MSTFKNFLKLKNRFLDVAEKNNTILTSITDGASERGSVQINGITMTIDSDDVIFYEEDDESSVELVSYAKEDMEDHLNDTIPGTDMKVSDYLTSVSTTGDIYTALATLTSKFSYSNRVRLTDVNDVIDRSVPDGRSLTYGTEDLKDELVAASDDEGYVTSQSWLATLQGWFDSLKDNADRGAATLDTTEPMTIGALYNVVVNVIESVLTVLLLAVKNIFVAILAIVGYLVAKIFSLIKTSAEQSAVINYFAPNDYIKGPCVLIEEVSSKYGALDNLPHDRRIWSRETSGLARFFWWNDDYTKIRMNYYFYPAFSPAKAADYLRSKNLDGQFDNVLGFRINFDRPGLSQRMGDSYEEESKSWIWENPKHMYAALCVDAFMRFMYAVGDPALDTYLKNIYGYDPNTWDGAFIPYGTATNPISMGCRMVKAALDGMSDPSDVVTIVALQEAIRDMVQNCFDNNYDRDHWTRTIPSGIATDPEMLYNVTPQGTGQAVQITPKLYLYTDDFGFFWNYTTVNPSYRFLRYFGGELTDLTQVDVLPTSFKIHLSGVTINDILVTLVIASTVAIAVAFGYSRIARNIRQKKILKSTLRTSKIEQAKAAWDEDPNNKQLAKAYAKEVDKYNRWGKVFGWGSYDARNQWINDVDGGDSTIDTTETTFDIYDNTKTVLRNNANQDSKLNQIIQLIKGM